MNITIKTAEEFRNAHVTIEIHRDGARDDERYTLVPADSERVEALELELRSVRSELTTAEGLAGIYRRKLEASEKARIELATSLDREKDGRKANREWAERAEALLTTTSVQLASAKIDKDLQAGKIEELEGVVSAQARALRAADGQLGKIREIAEHEDLTANLQYPSIYGPEFAKALDRIRTVLATSPQEETSQA